VDLDDPATDLVLSMDNPTTATTTARIAIAGTLEYRDADGNVIGTATMTGTLPLTPAHADEAEDSHGLDDD
jgi:hypothetical protein